MYFGTDFQSSKHCDRLVFWGWREKRTERISCLRRDDIQFYGSIWIPSFVKSKLSVTQGHLLQKLPKAKVDCLLNILHLSMYITYNFKPSINKQENTFILFMVLTFVVFPGTSSESDINFSLCFRNKPLFLMVREKKMKRLSLKSKYGSQAKRIQHLSSFHSSFF